MKVPLFVTSSAAILAAWLGVTFFRQVPMEGYVEPGREALISKVKPMVEEPEAHVAVILPEENEPMMAAGE